MGCGGGCVGFFVGEAVGDGYFLHFGFDPGLGFGQYFVGGFAFAADDWSDVHVDLAWPFYEAHAWPEFAGVVCDGQDVGAYF